MRALTILCLLLLPLMITSEASGTEIPPLRVRAVKLAEQQFVAAKQRYALGQGTLEQVVRWSRRWARVTQKRKALVKHLARMRALESEVRKRVASGTGTAQEGQAMEYFVVEAQLLLSKKR